MQMVIGEITSATTMYLVLSIILLAPTNRYESLLAPQDGDESLHHATPRIPQNTKLQRLRCLLHVRLAKSLDPMKV